MAEPTFQVVSADPDEKDGVRFWRVRWIGGYISLAREYTEGESYVSLYSEDTYQSRIVPRRQELWTLEEILDLPTQRT
jgi:hypothetical protein